ncbi:MAG: hypothetical protein IJ538_04430 [Clostridia bacterium]|nr:hypothetical protein [Clostridia bacterium]
MTLKFKSLKKISVKFLISIFVVIMIIYIPVINLSKSQADVIYSKFIGEKSDFDGMIEIWNIDSFDGVTKSKTILLSDIAKVYARKNKGVSFIIKNMTEFECFNALSCGEFPDLFSASYGIAKKLQNYVEPFANVSAKTYSNFLEAGKFNGLQFAVAWCFESYYLISTEKNLAAAKVEITDGKMLHDLALSSGYTVKTKKNTRTVYSLATSKSKYLSPDLALKAYNGIGLKTDNELSFNKSILNSSQFSAYSNFILGNSVILLGTNHDVHRMELREKAGKVQGIIYEPLTKFTDLVEFVFKSKNITSKKQIEVEKFVSFLTENESQQIVVNSKMFSVNGSNCDSISSVMTNITPEIIGNYALNNVFI